MILLLSNVLTSLNEFLSQLPNKEILLLVLGTLSTFLIWRLQHQKDKIKNIENMLSERKYKLYSELIYLIMDTMYSKKTGKVLTEQDLLIRMLDIKRDLFIYAPDKIFKAFTKWSLDVNNGNGTSHFKNYFKMMTLIRKEMGHNATKISLDDFMLFLMQNEKEYKKFKEDEGW